jgi:hypothetical protein
MGGAGATDVAGGTGGTGSEPICGTGILIAVLVLGFNE